MRRENRFFLCQWNRHPRCAETKEQPDTAAAQKQRIKRKRDFIMSQKPRNADYTREYNQKAVLRILRNNAMSRAELARATGLIKAATSLIVTELRNLLKTVDKDKVLGIGISSLGPLDRANGRILNPPNFERWHGVPIQSESECGNSGGSGCGIFKILYYIIVFRNLQYTSLPERSLLSPASEVFCFVNQERLRDPKR